ncbi:ribonuclease H-like domain-containing protein [Tanacetum coccineum]
MVTRFRVGTNRPPEYLNLHVSSVSPLPKSYRDVFNDPKWQNAMCDEYHALIKNNTWTLVPRPTNINIVRCMWLFHHKYHADVTLSRYKARIVANGLNKPLEPGSRDFPYILLVLDFTIVVVTPLFIYRHGTDIAYLLLYVDDIVLTASSENRTSVDNQSLKLGGDSDSVSDPTLYRSLAGSLQYLTFTRPNISYVVQQVCLYMHDPREPHLSALQRILRYVSGTLDYGLQLFSSSTTDLVAYFDADWAGCPTTRLVETCWYATYWLGVAFSDYLPLAGLIVTTSNYHCYYPGNPVQHQRTKHIEIDIHFVRDLIAARQIRVLHVPSRYQFADIFTKGLTSALFEEFRSRLSVRSPPASTAGEC